MNLKYLLFLPPSILLLPVISIQGKRIRREVPSLPEAKNPSGKVDHNFIQTKRILFIGESTFAGVGAQTHQEAFAGTFAEAYSQSKKVNVEWRVYARSGYTAKRMTIKLIPKIEETSADLIIIGCGGNDAFTLNTPSKWKNQVCTLLASVQHKFPETPIAFTNMPPIKAFPAFTKSIKFVIGNLVEILGDELNKIVLKHNNVFYNSEIINLKKWAHLVGPNNDESIFFSDGVHPSILTYQVWAKNFMEFLEKEMSFETNQSH